jgi:hypothetical protein
MIKTLLDFCPKTKEIIEKKKNKPTTEERLAALEAAMLEQILGGCENG